MIATLEKLYYFEVASGSHSRRGQQWDISNKLNAADWLISWLPARTHLQRS